MASSRLNRELWVIMGEEEIRLIIRKRRITFQRVSNRAVVSTGGNVTRS